MTLRELRAAHPKLFHPNQDWFDGEKFMDAEATPKHEKPPKVDRFVKRGKYGEPSDWRALPSAAELAALYVKFPNDPVWQGFLWTSDRDGRKQQVYVGGVALGKGFQLHRHLRIDGMWGAPKWK